MSASDVERMLYYREDRLAVSGLTVVEDVQKIFAASNKLQQVLGMQKAEPFKMPPAMPHDLIERFEEGLAEYGLANDPGKMDLAEQESQDRHKDMAKSTERYQEQQNIDTAPPSPNRESGIATDLSSELPFSPLANVEHFFASLFFRPPPSASPKVFSTLPKLSRLIGKDSKRARAESKQETARPAPLTLRQAGSKPEQQLQQYQYLGQNEKPRTDGQTGIPTLPASFTLAWTLAFPGNTSHLSQSLLRWHHTMTSLYRRCQEDLLVELHPLFPYPPTRPVNVHLLSISFWNTSSDLHREMRFIGPSDVSSILYAEVDTFHKDDNAGSRFKTALWGSARPTEKDSKRVDMREHNERGEGRWCFVVVHGRKKPGEDQGSLAPNLTLAWPVTAVTAKSECLYTICGNNIDASTTTPAPAARITQLASPSQNPMTSNMYSSIHPTSVLHNTLRSATSSTLPPPNLSPENKGLGKQKEELTVRRTTLLFQKAGGLPLVQAYRTDVRAWREVLEVIGRGEGKVVMNCKVD
jgi:hypothetical protein